MKKSPPCGCYYRLNQNYVHAEIIIRYELGPRIVRPSAHGI